MYDYIPYKIRFVFFFIIKNKSIFWFWFFFLTWKIFYIVVWNEAFLSEPLLGFYKYLLGSHVELISHF